MRQAPSERWCTVDAVSVLAPASVSSKFVSAVERAWTRETSSAPEAWSPANPAFGQCAVTALVVQDFYGGSLLRVQVGDVSHYWNVLPDGTELDLTRQQFGGEIETSGSELRDRAYVLSFPETARRYGILRARVDASARPAA